MGVHAVHERIGAEHTARGVHRKRIYRVSTIGTDFFFSSCVCMCEFFSLRDVFLFRCFRRSLRPFLLNEKKKIDIGLTADTTTTRPTPRMRTGGPPGRRRR